MNLLHVIPSVDPQGGGPIEGVRQLSSQMRQQGHCVEIVSLDCPDSGFLQDYTLKVHALGPSRLGYRYNKRIVPWMRAHASRYDAVIVNGLWQYSSFATWRALAGGPTPYYVFAHGMLDPWFKRTYPLKHLKKWLYWPWAEYRVLRDAQAVVFTCEEERLLARESFSLYRCNEAVTAYGTAAPPPDAAALSEQFLRAYPSLQGKRLLLFLGRIHKKKGCDLLIDAFAAVAARDPRLNLVMAGPDQDGWSAELQQRARQSGIGDRISWPGMLHGDLKWGAFYSSEVFVLPSHQENFGIAVAEALACGKPVLISNKVNIWREIEADKAGLVAADTLSGTVDSLVRWLAMPPEAIAEMAVSARRCFANRFAIENVVNNLIEILGPAAKRVVSAKNNGPHAAQPCAADTPR
jgi:glycosyltransferase involved in cell wall biosynthesis